MAYTVLARKYRSRTFEEVIGQEPIATTLVNAIRAGRIHHGYLFTGTRGVGKTSMARILAKALNCQQYDAPTTTPCCECDVCRAIAEGQDVDVLEIDAASNTGVDNIRELRSNTAYRPARTRYKVYIIDEVHMLSTGAFNALLKTLEEPPAHVKFILATTEVQKVPATIQSRCQRFTFRPISPDAIARRLTQIIAAEGATAEDAAVQRIARLAQGSMRDALSILDQVLSVAPQRLTLAVLEELLPAPQDEQVFGLLEQVAAADVRAVLTALDAILAGGRGLESFCNAAIEVVRTLMLVRACGADSSLVDLPAGRRDAYVRLSGCFELSHYVQMIAMLEELRRNARYSGAGRALTEVVLVRLARLRQWASIEQLLGQLPPTTEPPVEKKKDARADEAVSAVAGSAFLGGAVRAGASAATSVRARPAGGPPRATTEGLPADELPGSEPEEEDAAPPARAAASAPDSRERVRCALSVAERALVERDPVVRQTLELFDGVLIDVRRPVPGAGSAVEGAAACSATSDN